MSTKKTKVTKKTTQKPALAKGPAQKPALAKGPAQKKGKTGDGARNKQRVLERLNIMRGAESGWATPDQVTIVELEDETHPKHAIYVQRLDRSDPDILELAASMKELGWAEGSVVWIWDDGGVVTVAAGRRGVTAATIENERRQRERDPRGPIRFPVMLCKDPATAEQVENAHRVDFSPMTKARDFIAMRELHKNEHMAAALCGLALSTAHMLEKCLRLPVEVQKKVDRKEIPIDVAARMVDAGSRATRKATAAATRPDGRIDQQAIREQARGIVPTRAKAQSKKDVQAYALALRDRADSLPEDSTDMQVSVERAACAAAAAVLLWSLGGRSELQGQPILVAVRQGQGLEVEVEVEGRQGEQGTAEAA